MTQYVSHDEMTTLKMNLLGSMYEFVGQDEEAYSEWIQAFPDEPTEKDLKEIALDDNDWTWACEYFGRLVKRYGLK